MFGASEGIAAGDIIFFLLLLLLSIFIGRVFCGWICPAGSLQEAAFHVNEKPANNKGNWIKIALFIPWLIIFILLALNAGGIKYIDIFYKRAMGISIAGATEWIMYFGTVAIVLVLSLIAGKRGLCHHLCWVSPFMIIGGAIRKLLRLPSLYIKASPDSCSSCGICAKKCPMSLQVNELLKSGSVTHYECILCGCCVDSCPKGVIHFAFGRPKIEKAKYQKRTIEL
jgi:polyferredoxin